MTVDIHPILAALLFATVAYIVHCVTERPRG